MKLTLLYSGAIHLRQLEDKSSTSFLKLKSKAGQVKERHCEFYLSSNVLQVSLFKIKHKIPEILSYHRFEVDHDMVNYPFVGYLEGKTYFFFKDHSDVHFTFASEAECDKVLKAIFPTPEPESDAVQSENSDNDSVVKDHEDKKKNADEQVYDEDNSMNFGDVDSINHDVDDFLGLKPKPKKVSFKEEDIPMLPLELVPPSNSGELQSPRRDTNSNYNVANNDDANNAMNISDLSISSQPHFSQPPTRKTYVDRHQFGQIGADHEPVRRKHRSATDSNKQIENTDLNLSLPAVGDHNDVKSNPPTRSSLLASSSLDNNPLHLASNEFYDLAFAEPSPSHQQQQSTPTTTVGVAEKPQQLQTYSSPLRSSKPQPVSSPPREPAEFRIADLMLKSTPDHLSLPVTELSHPEKHSTASAIGNAPIRLGERKSNQRVNLPLQLHAPEDNNQMAVLKNEIQALSMMNNQLNLAIEQSDEQHREEMEAAFNEIAKLRSALDQSDIEKKDLINEFQDSIKMKETVVQVTGEFDKVFNLLSVLQKENEQMAQIKIQTDAELQRLLINEDELKQQVVQLASELADKSLQLSVHEKQIQETSQNLGQSTNELARKDKNLETATNRILDLKQSLHEAETANRSLREQLIDFESVSAKSKAQEDRIKLLESTLKHTEMELTASKMTEESNKLTISRLESLVQEQQHFVKDLTDKIKFLEDMKEKHGEAHMQLVISQDELSRLKIEKESVDREIIRMKAHCEAVEEDRRTRVREYDTLIASKVNEMETMRGQLSKAVTDADCLQNEVSLLQMRIEHQKDQTQKVQSEEQQLQRRLQLEQQSASNQIQALKQSLEQSQQQNVEVTSKWHQSEESLRQVSRESSQKMEEMEEVIASLRRMTQDMTSRLYLLEEQNHHLNQQWHTETTNHKILQEESHVKEEQWQHEKKQLLQKVQYLSDKLEELKGRFRQKEQGLKESEQCRQKDQESVATTLHELQQKIDSLQHTNNKYKDDYQTLLDERKSERKAQDEVNSSNQQKIVSLQHHLEDLQKSLDSTESNKNVELQRFLAKFTDVENQLLEERRQHLELQHKFKEEEESLRQEKKQHAELQRIKYEIEERLKYEEEKKRNIESEYTTYAEGMQKKVKVLESNLTERSLESTALHRKLTEAESGSQDQILTLSQRNKVLEDHLLQANHALKDAQQNGDKLDKLVLEKLQEIHQLSLQQQKQDFHMQELQRKQALQTETLQSLQDELQLKTTKLQEVEHRENECLQEKKVLARQVAEWTQKHSQLQQDFDFKTKQWTALTQTLQETEQMLTSLQQKHSQLQQEKDQLQLDLQHANRDLEYHKKQVVMMQQENERKEHELQEQHQRRMKHLQDQEALFLHSTNKKDEENQQLQEVNQQQSQELRKASQLFDKEQEKAKDLSIQVLSLKAQMMEMVARSELDQEREALNAQLQELTHKTAMLSNQSNSSTLRVQSLEKQNQQFKTYLDRLFSLPTLTSSMEKSEEVHDEQKESGIDERSLHEMSISTPHQSPSRRTISSNGDRAIKANEKKASDSVHYAHTCKVWEENVLKAQELLTSQSNFIKEITSILQHSSLASHVGAEDIFPAVDGSSIFASNTSMQNVKEVFKTILTALKRDVRQANHLTYNANEDETDALSSNHHILASCQHAVQQYLQSLLSEVTVLQERYQQLDQKEKQHENELQDLNQEVEDYQEQIKSLQDTVEKLKIKHDRELEDKLQELQTKQEELEKLQTYYTDREQQVATVYAENIESQKVEYREALNAAKEDFSSLLSEKANEIRELMEATKEKEMQFTKVSRTAQDKEYEIRRLQDEIELLQDKFRNKGEQLTDASNRIATLELKIAQEARQRHELDRALRKQINISSNMSIVDNSKVNISTNSRQSSPEKKDFIPQQQQLPTQKMVGQTSRQQGLMRSLSAQRRIPAPSSAAKEDDSLLFNRKSANPSQRFDQTKGNNTQQSSLISEETKRSVHDLIRLKNNTMPKSTFVAPTATNSSFNTDHSFQYDTSIDQAESKHIFGRRSHAATSSSSPGRSLALHDL